MYKLNSFYSDCGLIYQIYRMNWENFF